MTDPSPFSLKPGAVNLLSNLRFVDVIPSDKSPNPPLLLRPKFILPIRGVGNDNTRS
jgi:hypothetical protein